MFIETEIELEYGGMKESITIHTRYIVTVSAVDEGRKSRIHLFDGSSFISTSPYHLLVQDIFHAVRGMR